MGLLEKEEGNLYYKSENGLLLTKDGSELIVGINLKTAVEISSETAKNAKSAKNSEELSEFQEELTPTIFTKRVKSNCCKSHDISQTSEHLFAPFAFFAVSAKRSTAVFRINGDVVIPASVTSIGEYAFMDCTGLTSVTIPYGVTSIREYAFLRCGGLTSVTIPDGVKRIWYGTFLGCSSLASVALGEYVASVGESAFAGCDSLTTVTIPSSVTSVGEDAFEGCGGLKTIYVDVGDAVRVRKMVADSGTDIGNIVFEEMGEGTGVCKVTFNPNGGTVGETVRDVMKGAAAGTLPIPTRQGYDFLGWFTSASSGTAISASTVVGSDVTYFAQWKKTVVPSDPTPVVTNVVERIKEIEQVVTVYATNWVDVVVTNMVTNLVSESTYTNIIEQVVEVTNVVEQIKEVEKVVTVFETNLVNVAVTNYVEMVEPEATVVSDEVADFEPATGFDGSAKRTYNGIAYDGDGKLCGLVQIATAKESKSGVKVSGYVMLSDGKKLTIKSVNGSVADGLLVSETSVGKIGKLALAIGSDGFRGEMDEMTLVTANISEAGVVKGNLTVNYIEEKTNKWKTKTATVNGVAAEGTAAGTIKVKNEEDKSFLSVIE